MRHASKQSRGYRELVFEALVTSKNGVDNGNSADNTSTTRIKSMKFGTGNIYTPALFDYNLRSVGLKERFESDRHPEKR